MIHLITGMTAVGKTTSLIAMKNMKTGDGENIITPIRMITTRPRRNGETNEEYDFVTPERYEELRDHLLTDISFTRVDGTYRYGLLTPNMFDPDNDDEIYVAVIDPANAAKLKEEFGTQAVVHYIIAPTKLRRERFLSRYDNAEERKEGFKEWARREQTDTYDFITSGFMEETVDYIINTDESNTVEDITNSVLNSILNAEMENI